MKRKQTRTLKRLQGWQKTRGENNKQAKLTNAMARAIRRAYTPRKKGSSFKKRTNIRYNSMPYLASVYNVSVHTIWRIIHKKSYKSSKLKHDTLKPGVWGFSKELIEDDINV